jgi:hypothetical protein
MDLGTLIIAVFYWIDEALAEHRKKLLSTRCSHYGNHG